MTSRPSRFLEQWRRVRLTLYSASGSRRRGSACRGLSSSLGTYYNPTPTFFSVLPLSLSFLRQAVPEATAAPPNTTLIVPRVSNVGLVSTLLPANVTVTKDPSATWLNVTLNQNVTPVTAFLSRQAAPPPGVHATTLQFSAPGVPSVPIPSTYTVAAGPWFTEYGFDHSAAATSSGVVAPGEPFVIFGGDSFGPPTLAPPALDANGRAVTTLGGTQVLFDGVPAPLYYSVDNNGVGQVAGFAPFGLDGKHHTVVQVVYNGVTSPPVALDVLDAVPGLFTADSSGGGQGSILNQNASINGPNNPEAAGNLVVLFGGGAGQTTPAGRDGALAGAGAPVAVAGSYPSRSLSTASRLPTFPTPAQPPASSKEFFKSMSASPRESATTPMSPFWSRLKTSKPSPASRWPPSRILAE